MRWTVVATLFLISGCASTTGARILAPDDPRLKELAFLSGSWSSFQDGLSFDEHWAPPSGGTMLGVSRVVKGDRTVFHEFVLIEHTAEGIFFRVRTAASPETVSFRRIADSRPGGGTFENPAHDFPTRISYWMEGETTLRARIEGTREGKPASEEFLFHRSVIEGPDPEP